MSQPSCTAPEYTPLPLSVTSVAKSKAKVTQSDY
jgi:hypothetical protein